MKYYKCWCCNILIVWLVNCVLWDLRMRVVSWSLLWFCWNRLWILMKIKLLLLCVCLIRYFILMMWFGKKFLVWRLWNVMKVLLLFLILFVMMCVVLLISMLMVKFLLLNGYLMFGWKWFVGILCYVLIRLKNFIWKWWKILMIRWNVKVGFWKFIGIFVVFLNNWRCWFWRCWKLLRDIWI